MNWAPSRRYLRETQQSEHTYKRIRLPKPELYIIYTGNKDVQDEISLNDDYFNGEGSVDLRVNILKQPGTETIYGQYIGFCKVYDEQRNIHKNKVECIKETIRICQERGYLTNFLGKHKKEVYTMMSELFDEEYQRNQYDIAVKIIEREEGMAEGMEKGKNELVKSLLAVGRSIKEIAKFFKTDESEIQAMIAAD